MDCSHVLVTVASHDGRNDFATTEALLHARDEGAKIFLLPRTMGLVESHNECLCQALNMRDYSGITHWCNLHSDVGPQGRGWLSKMLAAMEGCLDVLSLVVRIKDDSELTSTAVLNEKEETFHRDLLSLSQIRSLPETFTGEDCHPFGDKLLINTGCMVWDITKPWVNRFSFRIENSIVRGEFGQYSALAIPEDWSMSLWLEANAVPYGAYSGVTTAHAGREVFKTLAEQHSVAAGV